MRVHRLLHRKVPRSGKYSGFSDAAYDSHDQVSDYLMLDDGPRLAYDLIRPALVGVPETRQRKKPDPDNRHVCRQRQLRHSGPDADAHSQDDEVHELPVVHRVPGGGRLTRPTDEAHVEPGHQPISPSATA